MQKSDARKALVYLVEKYISDFQLKEGLLHDLSEPSKPMVPVRGIVDEVMKHKNQPISQQDKELVDDLFYFFG